MFCLTRRGGLGGGIALDDDLFVFSLVGLLGAGFDHLVGATGGQLDFVCFFLDLALPLECVGQELVLLLADFGVGVLLNLMSFFGKVVNDGLDADVEVLGHFVQSETCHIIL